MRFEGEAEIAPCPSDAALGAYIDKRASLAERYRVELHMARCSRCVEVVANVIQFFSVVERGQGWTD
jgi:hypothetical protein